MKLASFFVVFAFMLGFSGVGYCESNPVAMGVEKITKAPFTLLGNGSDELFHPANEMGNGIVFVTDQARAATVSAVLNLGQPVE